MTRTSAARRFVLLHLASLAGLLALVGSLNVAADPFDYFRPALNGTLDPYKKRSATRYAKANVVAAGDWDVILCGASRTEIGFDPQHPVWAGRKVYNFGLGAAKYREIWQASKFALESNPHLQTLWIELDPSYLIHKPFSDDFLTSRYHPQADRINYAFGQLFGSRSTERSVSALAKWWKNDRADDYYTAQGLRVRPIRPPSAIPWDWFERELEQGRSRRADQTAAHQTARDDPDAPWLDLSFLESLPELLTKARRQGTQVCVIVPSAHVVRLAQFIDEERYNQVNEFKRQIATLVGQSPPLDDGRPSVVAYDFLVDDEANAEPLPTVAGEDTLWHWEAGHFRVELGNRMLEQIATGQHAPPGTFGAALTPQTIDEHLAVVAASLSRRLPTVAMIRKTMDCERLVQRLQPNDARVLATRPDEEGRVVR